MAASVPRVPASTERPTSDHELAVDGVEALIVAPDLRSALAAAWSALDAVGSGRRVAVAIVDARDRITGSAPVGRAIDWARPGLVGATGRTVPASPGPWAARCAVLDGIRAVVLVDDPTPGPALTERAALAAIGVARAALLERDRSRADAYARLIATAKRVAISLELRPLLEEIVHDAAALIGADSGDMLLLDEEREMLTVVALANFPPDMLGLEFPFGDGLSTQAILTRRPIIVTDYLRYEHRIQSLDRYDLRSVLCAPLVVRDRAIGALNVHGIRAQREFTAQDAELLGAFGDLAAIAIDHARRYENEMRLGRELTAANDELTQVLSLQRRLSDLVVLDLGVEAMVRELAARLDRPLVLHDHLWRLVAGASPDGGEGWRSLVLSRNGGSGRRRPAAGPGSPEAASMDTPGRAPAGASQLAPIRVGRETVAHLVLEPREVGPLDLALLETACTGLALEFAKVLARVEVEHRLRGDAVMDLLSGSYTSEEAMIARAAHLGHDVREPHVVMVVDIDDFHLVTEREGETAAVRMKRRFFDLVHAEVVARAPGSLLSAQSDSVIVLLVVRPGARLTPEALAANLQQLVASALPGVTISVGIGDRASRPDEYAPAFRVARESLDLMHRLGRHAVIIGAGQLGAYRLLLRTSAPDELREYARRTLGPLLDPERRGSGELLGTLRAYLDSGGSQRATARACSVHVNTVVYRLGRMADILGRDLSDPATVFDLTLALRIVDVAGVGGETGV
jgi:sugar diacid utilization regulator/GAF domain-containing protein